MEFKVGCTKCTTHTVGMQPLSTDAFHYVVFNLATS